MKVRYRSIFTAVMIAASFLLTSHADAQILKNLPFGKAKPSQQIQELTDEVGPWVIMCYSFSGEDGAQQARRLAKELRSYELDAYTYTHRTDLTQKIKNNALIGKEFVRDAEGKEILGPDGKPILVDQNLVAATNMRNLETAVVIGSFSSADDERAQKVLKSIKAFAPKSLAGGRLDDVRNQTNMLNDGRAFSRNSLLQSSSSLRNAFLLPNPLLSDEFFQAMSVDQFVINLNKRTRFSLLDCPGKYSVRVATFRGKSVFDASEMKKKHDEYSWLKRNNKGTESELDKCMNRANALTKALRKENVEAYEFHDREESYVCVGSFDWLKKVDGAGNEIQNPRIRETIKKYKGTVKYTRQGIPAAMGKPVPRSLPKYLKKDADKIAYDVQPLPVICPKAPTSRVSKLFSKWR